MQGELEEENNLKDYRVLPKCVVFEGINRCGKTTIINEFKENYGEKQIQVIKFPFQKKIIEKIVFLYREIEKMSDMKQMLQYLDIIHQLFDLDFRQFSTLKEIDDVSKVYFLDRYYPSNLVYAQMHGIEINPIWSENHCLKPDVAINLQITTDENKTKYMRDFPIIDTSNNEISNNIQILTPHQLLYDGQVFYNTVLDDLWKQKKIYTVISVEALQEDTYRNVEKALIRRDIL